jgi:DNA polymerase-4
MKSVRAATILHADLDAFYASVEQLLEPTLRKRPIAVGGGVVLAASYEARSFGVAAGMSGWQARRLCPGLHFVHGHFAEYQRLGDQAVAVFRDFTPWVERISIDEAFLDVAGARKLLGSPRDIAVAIRRRVRSEVGLPISVGVATTKHLAKVASQVAKPDGLVVVEHDQEAAFLEPLPVELLWGVGPATRDRLAGLGIRTIGELAAVPGGVMNQLFGKVAGNKLASLAINVDPRGIQMDRTRVSVGAQAALGRREPSPTLVRSTLGYLADRVAGRLRAAHRAGRTVSVKVRFADLRSVTRSATVPVAISATLLITELATNLAGIAIADHPREREITLLAISVSNLVDEAALQLELPLTPEDCRSRPGTRFASALWAVDRAMDAVRLRFGRGAVGYAANVYSDAGRVPDAFRELAEHDIR